MNEPLTFQIIIEDLHLQTFYHSLDYSHARFRTDDGRTYYSKQYDEELELIATSFVEPDTVWFILPNYTVYTTFDPFINNYFLPEFRD